MDQSLLTHNNISHSPLREENAIENKKFLTDREYFKAVETKISVKIPREALDIVWYGISHVPKTPQLCKGME